MPGAELPGDICGLALKDQDIGPHLACLSVEEHGRLGRIKHPLARRHFVLGRSALRSLLGEISGRPPADIGLWTGEDGAVRCDLSGWRCSIAHADERIVAVAAQRLIGVDVEVIKPREPGIASYMLRPEEREMFDALPLDRTHAIIMCWTLKEAALKAVRIGLRQSAKACQLDIDYGACTAKVAIDDPQINLRAAFAEQDGYYISIAWSDTLS